jgi:hypothetical protein
MEGLGPAWRVYMVTLGERMLVGSGGRRGERGKRKEKEKGTYGDITINENKNAVLSQFIAVSSTLKYAAASAEIGAKVNH